jgi:hypothetical protein
MPIGCPVDWTQLGSVTLNGSLQFVCVPTGSWLNPPAGTLNAWILAPAYTVVQMVNEYEPSTVNRFPARGGLRGGETVSLPSIEAAALIAAGYAAAV